MADAIGRQRDRHAAQRRHQVDDRQQPARLFQRCAEILADRGEGGWRLADLEGCDHAGRDQQGGQRPRRTGWRQYCTREVMAPSTTMLMPVMNEAGVPDRNTTALATSCGVPMRPVGLRASERL